MGLKLKYNFYAAFMILVASCGGPQFTKFEQKTVDQVVQRASELITELLSQEAFPKNQQTISVI